MSLNNWNIKNQDENLVKQLSNKLNCCDFVSRLLINRGITDFKDAKEFLSKNNKIFHNPFILKDMQKAVDRIVKAVNQKQKIVIYGDYDVDGITSISVLYLYLKELGVRTDYYIPDRVAEGYGINKSAIDIIAKSGCDLIITVDTGISAICEAEYINSLGIDLIITDHHECSDNIPKAVAVIDPKRQDEAYPFKELAGVGVAFKLICALDTVFKKQFVFDRYSAFVALGTISDMMSLKDENRYIVRYGLNSISSSKSTGLNCLIKSCIKNNKVNSTDVSFILAPKINAAGRIADAQLAVELFTTYDIGRADQICQTLLELNKQRQQMEHEIFKQAVEQIENGDLCNKYNALVLWANGWHNGIIGIVASKLKERYHMPVFLFALDETGDTAKGSGRSVMPFNLYCALEQMTDIIETYGGHKDAAGAVVKKENLLKFRTMFSELVGRFLENNTFYDVMEAECYVSASELNTSNAEQISLLEPFGKSNITPVFCFKDAVIENIKTTANQKHLKLMLNCQGKKVCAFLFNKQMLDFDYRLNDCVDILFEMSIYEYNNLKNLQFIIRDIRYCENTLKSLISDIDNCKKLTYITHNCVPNRAEIATVYKYLLIMKNKNKSKYNMLTLPRIISADTLTDLNCFKVKYSIDILQELKVLAAVCNDYEIVINDINNKTKVSLLDSQILKNLQKRAGELVEH